MIFNAEELLTVLQDALERDDFDSAIQMIEALRGPDQARLFSELEDEEQRELLPKLDLSYSADILEDMDDPETAKLASSLPIDTIARIVDEMEPDKAVDLLGDLTEQQKQDVLARLDDADGLRPLLIYPDESAGGLMTSAFLALRPMMTARDAVEALRRWSPDADDVYYLFVVDDDKKLCGVVNLRTLILTNPESFIKTIMDPDVLSVTVGIDQEECARTMAHYDLAAIPVVDEDNIIMGVITYDDIVDVLEEEATEDIYRLSNVSDSDLDPDSSVWKQLKGRLPWLYLNTITALFGAWVISNYEQIIAQAAVLALFQSVVAGQGGNTASQNVAMAVRTLALERVSSRSQRRIIFRQLYMGFLLGLAVGSVVAFGVYLWRGNLYLSLVLGLALVANLSLGSLVGIAVPLGLEKIGIDPALASSVLVTAATDSMGFFIFLSLAAHFLQYIQ
ncbi:MAG: magnesium transporter [Anaerolineae bacterium]|jgi:magnesium transporter|nr:magnesium transporter [Anaerolineae bacterium]MBT7070368.1 magnesium transporter [Anaerolineae bacterium]MBT7324410.1 magnesium transporter [Anaerolineae bacterium]